MSSDDGGQRVLAYQDAVERRDSVVIDLKHLDQLMAAISLATYAVSSLTEAIDRQGLIKEANARVALKAARDSADEAARTLTAVSMEFIDQAVDG